MSSAPKVLKINFCMLPIQKVLNYTLFMVHTPKNLKYHHTHIYLRYLCLSVCLFVPSTFFSQGGQSPPKNG